MAYSAKSGVSKADFEALKTMLLQLPESKQAELRSEIAAIPEPTTPEAKASAGSRILAWFNKNAEAITQNLAASAYYDGLKFLLELS